MDEKTPATQIQNSSSNILDVIFNISSVKSNTFLSAFCLFIKIPSGCRRQKNVKKIQLLFKEKKCTVLETQPRNTCHVCRCFVSSDSSRQAQRKEAWPYFVLLPHSVRQLPNLLGRERSVKHNGNPLSSPITHL